MEDTKTEKLGNYILDIAAGPFGSNLKVECFVPNGFPIIDGANLKGFKVSDSISKFVTEEKARSLHRSIAKRNDVVVTISGNVGQISYIPEESAYEEYLVSQRQFRVTFDTSRVYVPYLVYYFHTLEGQHKILSFANQTGVPALAQPLKNFKKIDIVLPSIAIQKRIASILKSLDDKIEVNRRINDNLEQQAQALFKSWFVDFEPFRDQPFVESELGMIPKEWRVGTIGELCSLVSGFAFQSCTYVDKGLYRLVTIKNVQDGYLNSDGAVCLNEVPSRMPIHCLLKIGDILLSLTGNVGRCCFVNEKRLLLNQRVAKIKPNKDSFWGYIYTFFRNEDIKTLLISIARGTAQANLSPVETLKLTTIVPANEVIEKFSKIVNSLYEEFIKNMIESRRLSQLRDTLLPRLMSGELSVDGLKGQFAVSPGRCPGSKEHVSNNTAL